MLANIITDFTDRLDSLSANWWFLIIIFVVAVLDSVIPILPSETTVIIGGVAAGQGNQSIVAVILVAAAGAFCGDNLAYFIGHHFRDRVDRWADRRPSRRRRLDGAAHQIRKRGGVLFVTARFVPAGRTIVTLSSGVTNQPHRWFAGWIAIATLIWATYAGLLGFLFGQTFANNHTIAFVLAFAAALAISGVTELVRWVLERRKTAH